MKQKVVVAEEIAPAAIRLLAAECEVDLALETSRPQLMERLVDADALVVRSGTKVDAELLGAAPDLVVVGRAGTGVDNIDLEAATAAGVLVVNAPTANAVSAAEHAMALLLAQARRVPEADASLRSGAWERERFHGVELHGKTLGILGLGRIGGLVAARARAFGMTVIAYDPFVGEERARRAGAALVTDLGDLLGRSDFVTIHLPLTRQTEGLIDAEALADAKEGIRIVNASRGGIVDEAALADAIAAGRVAGAALDVFAVEPPSESPLFDLPQVVVTPHLGAATAEAQDKAGTDVARSVVDALNGELVTAAVNIDLGSEVPEELNPYLPLAEHLGAVFVRLLGGLPDELLVRVEGRLADLPTRPVALAALKGALGRVIDQPVSFVNAQSIAASRGIRLVEAAAPGIEDYAAVVRVSNPSAEGSPAVAGSIIGRKGPVIIEALGYEIEFPFSRHMLMLLNDDVPGVIGRVGAYLGDLGVNIANMVVGRSAVSGEAAMMGLNIDRSLDETEIAGFRDLDGVFRAWLIDS